MIIQKTTTNFNPNTETTDLNRRMAALIREDGVFFISFYAGIRETVDQIRHRRHGSKKYIYQYHVETLYQRVEVSKDVAKFLFNKAYELGIAELPYDLQGNVTIRFNWSRKTS